MPIKKESADSGKKHKRSKPNFNKYDHYLRMILKSTPGCDGVGISDGAMRIMDEIMQNAYANLYLKTQRFS